MSVNHVQLLGRLGDDPTIRYSQKGTAVANIRLCTNSYWKDAQGNRQERAEWHRVVVWGKQAENCGKFLQKGRQVFITGRLETRKWTAQDGTQRYTTEVVANNVVFLGSSQQKNTTEVSEEVLEDNLPSVSEDAQLLLNEEAPF